METHLIDTRYAYRYEPTLPIYEMEECYGEPYELFAWIAERHEPIEDEL
jgi:hypothetical protein